jgi:hypothetical protein
MTRIPRGHTQNRVFPAGHQGYPARLLGTLLTCAGIPLDRPIGIATKQLTEVIAT